MEKAAAKLSGLIGEVGALREKVAGFERMYLAEDIALMQAAEGAISYEELLDERDKLASGDENLDQVKMAMQRYGPGKTMARTVVVEDDDSVQVNKSAAKANEPDHLAQARLKMEQVFADL